MQLSFFFFSSYQLLIRNVKEQELRLLVREDVWLQDYRSGDEKCHNLVTRVYGRWGVDLAIIFMDP